MKKTLLVAGVLVSSLAMAQNFVVEPKLSFDLVNSSKTTLGKEKVSKYAGRGIGLGVEARTEVLKNLEVGLGLEVSRRSVKNPYKAITDEFIANFKKDGNSPKPVLDSAKSEGKGKSIISVPVYVVAKYKFDEIYGVNPYVKGKLGYSFNRLNQEAKFNVDLDESHKLRATFKTKAKNSVSFGLSTGVEYKNFTVDLGYNLDNFKVVTDLELTNDLKILLENTAKSSNKKLPLLKTKKSVKNHMLTLNVGYAFNFSK